MCERGKKRKLENAEKLKAKGGYEAGWPKKERAISVFVNLFNEKP